MHALVDAMWCDRAPTSARKSAQNQIARLRQTFGADLIVTEGDRYQLTALTDVAVIDETAHRFDPLSASIDDITAVVGILATWRGEPFADLTECPYADAERARLDMVQARLVEALSLARLGGQHGTTTTRSSTSPCELQRTPFTSELGNSSSPRCT